MKNAIFILALIAFFFSCSNDDTVDCSLVDIVTPAFFLTYQDAQGNYLLNTVYQADSLRLYNNNSELYLRTYPTGDFESLYVYYNGISDDTDYYLELTDTDTDTLKFKYTITPGDCAPNYTLKKVIYNGEEILASGKNEEIIVLVK